MRLGSLFAGIGGFDLGFEAAGFTPVWQVEIDPGCREVLRRHWPDVTQYADIREANPTPVDVIVGGFPCQDLSVAGKHAGLSGKRSGLFYEMVRIVNDLRPRYLVWENVPGLLSSDHGRDFMRVLVELDNIGYAGCWTSLDAQYFGLAQRRRRIFGVFARGDIGAESCAEILALTEGGRRHPAPIRGARAGIAPTVTGGFAGAGGGNRYGMNPETAESLQVVGTLVGHHMRNSAEDADRLVTVAAPLVARQAKGGFTDPVSDNIIAFQPRYYTRGNKTGGAPAEDQTPTLSAGNGGFGAPGVAQAMSVRRLTPLECERLQGFPDGWTAGQSDSARYRQLGNAVAVPCAEWIAYRMAKVMGFGFV